MSLSQDIKDFGLDLGFNRVGITTADGFPEHVAELKARSEMYSYHISGRRDPLANAFPARVMPTAKAIVSLVYDFAGRAFPDTLVGKIGRVYQARCYLAPPERINGARLSLMRQFLESNGCHVGSDIFLPERRCAARAGIATYGSNTFAFADGIGSFIVLYSFVVDMELDVDEPTLEVRCPPGCTLCVDNCPTGALYEPLKLDPRRCIAFNTFATQDGGAPGVTSDIPHEIRVKMGSWIHGCDVCQEVCPRNKDKLESRLPQDAFLVGVAKELDLSRLLNLDDEFYEKRVRPVMYNYIREKKYFQRNAAIALGNTKDPAYAPDLIRALDDTGTYSTAFAILAGLAASGSVTIFLARKPAPPSTRRAGSRFSGCVYLDHWKSLLPTRSQSGSGSTRGSPARSSQSRSCWRRAGSRPRERSAH